MSAAAITSTLLPQGQGGAALPAATQGALAILDSVFGAILKGVGSGDEGSQITAREFQRFRDKRRYLAAAAARIGGSGERFEPYRHF